MAPIDGAIGMKININHPQTTDVNISKAQPSKASGLGGVRCLRSKSAPTLYKYRFYFGPLTIINPACPAHNNLKIIAMLLCFALGCLGFQCVSYKVRYKKQGLLA